MKVTKKKLFDFCNENNDALNELQSQSDSTDFVLSTLIDQLKDLGVIDKLGDEPSEPKPKQLDQSVFDGLDAKWRFAAVDRSGRAFLFSRKPTVDNIEWYAGSIADYRLVFDDFDTTNWQNSLIERKELTGSDLCRAMLARGDTYIKCFCHNDAELSHFSNYERPYLITKYWENGCFSASDSCCYKYAVPINNQGEPLTQSDVGL